MKHLPEISIVLLLLLAACGKKDSVSNSNCKIISYKDSGNYTNPAITNITYNNDGKVSVISMNEEADGSSLSSSVFTYVNNNLVLVNTTQGGKFYEYDSIKLNNNGAVSYMYSLFSNQWKLRETFSYDGNGQLQSIVENDTRPDGSVLSPSAFTYQYTNGDLTGISENNSPYETYTYYDTKANKTGDAYQMEQLQQYGTVFVKNAHLLKSDNFGYINGSPTIINNYSYSFDGSGKITGVTTTSGVSISNRTYDYSCN